MKKHTGLVKAGIAISVVVIVAVALQPLVFRPFALLQQTVHEEKRASAAAYHASLLDLGLRRVTMAMDRYILSPEQRYLGIMQANHNFVNDHLAGVQELTRLEETRSAITEFEALRPQRVTVTKALQAKLQAGMTADQLVDLRKERDGIDDAIYEQITRITEAELEALPPIQAATAKQLEEVQKQLSVFLLILAGAGIVLLLCILHGEHGKMLMAKKTVTPPPAK